MYNILDSIRPKRNGGYHGQYQKHTKRRNNDNYNAKCDSNHDPTTERRTGTAIRAAAAASWAKPAGVYTCRRSAPGWSRKGSRWKLSRPRRNPGKKGDYRGLLGRAIDLLSSSPTPSIALPGKVENLTPPANGKIAPGWSTASASRDAGTPPAGTVPALTMPTGTASRSAQQPAPGRTPPEPLPPVQTKGQSSSARRAVCPGLFLLPIFPPLALLPARCTGSPAGSVRISDGPARSMTPPAPRRRSRSPRPPAPPARSRPTPTAPPAPHR